MKAFFKGGLKPAVFALLILGLALAAPASAWAKPHAAGDTLPDLRLPAKGGPVLLSKMKKPWALIQVFNMYCTTCQAEAKRVNQVYQALGKAGLAGKVAMLGIGAGNSPFEVGVYRKRYKVPFPLYPDKSYALHKALGQPFTPHFLLAQKKGDKFIVRLAHTGPFGKPEEFLARLKKAMAHP